ncbi:hypothetical protein B566_EDAN015356 [Ephemera danica]|nr:hypothetical protein B566_EDAN015356 [Ephemera danica]
MDLVTIDSAAEDQLIVNYLYNYYVTNGIPKSSDAFFWIGLNDLAVDRSFNWVATGQPLGGYTNWSPGQPAGTGEHCGEYMYRDAPRPAWNDRSCTDWTGPFICEVNAPCKCYAGV